MIQAEKHKAKFVKRTKLTDLVYTSFFEKPKGFRWLPGQYLRWTLSHENPDDRGTSRYFTNSSSPTEEFLSITTNRGRSSFKNTFFSLKKGDELNFFGPLGSLYVTEKDSSPKVMLAGGIGMTPFRAILKYANDQKLKIPLTLLVSFSLKEEVVYYDELKMIEKSNPNIKVVYSLTKENEQGFESGRISQDLILKYVPDYKDSTFFIVGQLAMSESLFKVAEDMGVVEDKIITENFTGY